MTSRHSPGNRDQNEPVVMEPLKWYHVEAIQLSEGQGADWLILLAPMFFVEVKNPNRPLSKRRLTDGEQKMKAACEALGIGYYVVEYSDQLVDILERRLGIK